jgi:hypothetical protein
MPARILKEPPLNSVDGLTQTGSMTETVSAFMLVTYKRVPSGCTETSICNINIMLAQNRRAEEDDNKKCSEKSRK